MSQLRNKKMFSYRTEPTLFWAGTVPETVPVRSLTDRQMDGQTHDDHWYHASIASRR